jgi:hypothetical protein
VFGTIEAYMNHVTTTCPPCRRDHSVSKLSLSIALGWSSYCSLCVRSCFLVATWGTVLQLVCSILLPNGYVRVMQLVCSSCFLVAMRGQLMCLKYVTPIEPICFLLNVCHSAHNGGLSCWYVLLPLLVIIVHCDIRWITHHSGEPMMEDRQFTFTTSLINVPKITFSDVHRLPEQHSIIARSKLDKGYSLFFEKYIYDYEGECLLSSLR